jgi:hypothetical protein
MNRPPAVLRAALLACACTLAHAPARAQAGTSASARPARTLRTAQAVRATGPIHVDGKLDEPAWAAAEPTGDFTQSYPNTGSPATQRTEVRILYDDAALYVGVRAFDTHPDSIAAQLARRDVSGIYSDWIHVVVDTYHDRHNGFRFSVNPRGVQKDVLHSDDTSEDLNWDAVWEVSTTVDSAGWTAEYRIPFSQLRFGAVAPGTPRLWGLQVQRDVARHNERDSWSPWTRQDPGYMSSEGDLAGITGVPMPRRLEVLPYVSTRLDRAPDEPGNPFYRRNDAMLSAGADVKAGLPGGLTLSGTINPDFGQVEVDPAVVNLSAFETFFPEKRPFFVEGADVFSFGRVRVGPSYNFQQFFYSRRIGAAPHGYVDGAYVDAPDQSTILGAAKVSGKTGPWTVGVLEALTAEEHARYVTSGGVRGTATVEPWTNFVVGRVRRQVGTNTVFGAMASSVNRALGDTTLASLLRSHAEFGGVDFEQHWRGGWIASGYAAGTDVAGRPEVIAAAQRSSARYYQRPDADYLTYDPTRTSLTGYMAELGVQKTGALGGSIDLKTASPGFEINDVGFMGRTDYRAAAWGVSYSSPRATKRLNSWNAFFGNDNAWNFGGDRIWNSWFWNAGVTLNSLWGFGVYGELDPGTLNDRLTRGGPLMRAPTSWNVGVFGNSNSRRRVTFSWNAGAWGDPLGGNARSASGAVAYRPSASVRISVGPSFFHLLDTQQYLTRVTDPAAAATYGARYVFADIHQNTVSADTRVDWTFTRTLSLQLYAQPFVSAAHFSRFKELRRAGTKEVGVYGRGGFGSLCHDAAKGTYMADPAGNCAAPGGASASAFTLRDPDFNFRSLRGNAVLRWEYRPGSALFFVWQQERAGAEPFGDFRLGRDAGAIFRQPARNVFVVKATYWLGR